ncbi:hypothetical protein ACJMK2_027211 [Sinanodonta woodiana]|uniref:SWIM-type domain-containing protein n=1 Tax=Sinanodonta woodiana TaxID=1069815 RepID=A0ABD3XP76_SINWO
MRVRQKPLEPWVIVATDGSMETAHCTCMAGHGECCNHVAAVLFALETGARICKEATVTDVPAYWMLPPSDKFETPDKGIKNMDFQSALKNENFQVMNRCTAILRNKQRQTYRLMRTR